MQNAKKNICIENYNLLYIFHLEIIVIFGNCFKILILCLLFKQFFLIDFYWFA